MGEIECYKVVTENMQSLGLRRNPNILTYPIGEWVHEKEPCKGSCDNGGIWAATTLSSAKKLKKYMEDEKKRGARVFRSLARDILYKSEYRVKVKSIILLEELLTDFESKQSSNATQGL